MVPAVLLQKCKEMCRDALKVLLYKQRKAPMYFKQNRWMNWYDIISNKIRLKRSSFWVCFGSLKPLTKANFLGEFFFYLLYTFELPLVCGDNAIGGCVLEHHLLWRANIFYIFSLVHFSFDRGQAGEHHLQVTSKINTLCWIAELPQIYPHLYNHSRGDFKDSEKAFNS